MTSAIRYNIDETFPVAGQDNDTQVFRDNFDTIKTSLRVAGEEITDIQDNGARLDNDNDFGLNIVQNAVFQNNREQRFDGGAVDASPTTIDFQNGSYQTYRVTSNIEMDFLNFPGDPVYVDESTPIGVGKVTLELYGNGGSPLTVTFTADGGTVFKKNSDFPNPFTLESASDPVFIEVWRHSADVIFMRYLGQFTE